MYRRGTDLPKHVCSENRSLLKCNKWEPPVEKKMKKKRAITDFNAPNGTPDIPIQSQEFGQDGHRHFVGFQPHFHLNMTSQTQCWKTLKK